jgi:hydrogenase maturation protein HypF
LSKTFLDKVFYFKTNLKTYHIHIEGIVQGVGFRPFVYKLALQNDLKGWVNNTNDGVHIEITDSKEKSETFFHQILNNLPKLAIVTHYNIYETKLQHFDSFQIVESDSAIKPKLLITPDVAMCEECKSELHNSDNRRFQYPFITCTNCGPRYSIIQNLPYDRPFTTMDKFEMCPVCQEEYNNPFTRRHFSQTNSCSDCRVEMQLYFPKNSEKEEKLTKNFNDLDFIIQSWNEGKIIAIKGIGGYLLTCDATNAFAVEELRKRKHRPSKPFALMFPNMEKLSEIAYISEKEKTELLSISAPIVLLNVKEKMKNIAYDAVNKGLTRIGVMLPYTPLMDLLLNKFSKPIVATSANISNSTIIFEDDKAKIELSSIADLILMNNRQIVIPQDDGVVQFTPKHQIKITLRRSRGKAPIYINPNLQPNEHSIFATGAMLKSVFAMQYQKNFYVTQYLGNTESYDAQQNYIQTFEHLQNIFNIRFDTVVTDKHPDYFSTRFGQELSKKYNANHVEVQHHKAHFWSVLGEHNLIKSKDPILGIIWDGTGLGDDGNIWGGEFFLFENSRMERVAHLDEFPFILGDKMPKEPRISALALTQHLPESNTFIKDKFSETEWKIYSKLIKNTTLKCTSMGRLFDAVSSILFGFDVHSFEAEASMKLENEANKYYFPISSPPLDGIDGRTKYEIQNPKKRDFRESNFSYFSNWNDNQTFTDFLFQNIFKDLSNGLEKQEIAYKFHCTLVDYIAYQVKKYDAKKIAFSGGVFQNALLVDLIYERLSSHYLLFFQEDFSPNDEGIAFGQLMSITEI